MTDVKLYLADFEERRKKFRKRLRWILLGVGIFALLSAGFLIVFRSPILKVAEVRVVGNRRVPAEDIIRFVTDAAGTSSIFARAFGPGYIWVWPTGNIEHDPNTLPKVKKLHLEKSYRDRVITVSVEERDPYGVWCLRKQSPPDCFWFESDGTVFEPAPEVAGSLIKVVADYASDNLFPGKKVLADPFMPALAAILDVMAKAPVDVKEVRYEEPSRQEMRVLTYDGPQIYFSLRFPAENALPVLESLVEKDRAGQLKPRFKDLQYVDFRVQNRAYYK